MKRMFNSHSEGLSNPNRILPNVLMEALERRQLLSAVLPSLGLFRPGQTTLYLDHEHDSLTNTQRGFGLPGDQIIAADFNGDTISDTAIFRTGTWYIDLFNDGTIDRIVSFGAAKGIGLAADVNGDGVVDLATYNPLTGRWLFDYNQDGIAEKVLVFGGNAGDVPLLGDMNNDGIADPIIYNAGTWKVDCFGDGTIDSTYHFGGASDDIPLITDIDGNAIPDLAVFNKGLWSFDTNRDGTTDIAYRYGLAGDRPFTGYFDSSRSIFVRPGASNQNNGSIQSPVGTINRALQLASPGTKIRLAAGTYAENVGFALKNDLTFIGAGFLSTHISPTSGDAMLVDRSTNIWINNINFASGGSQGRGLISLGSSIWAQAISTVGTRQDGMVASINSSYPAYRNYLDLRASHFDLVGTGQGLWLQSATNALIRMCTFNGNGTDPNNIPGPTHQDGGRGLVVSGDCTADIGRDSHFLANYNGGLFGTDSSAVTVRDSAIGDSVVGNGALFCNTSTVDIRSSIIYRNGKIRSIGDGFNGVEFLLNSYHGKATLIGNTFLENTAFGIFIGSSFLNGTGNSVLIQNNIFDNNMVGVAISGDNGNSSSALITGNTFRVPIGTTGQLGIWVYGGGASGTIGSSSAPNTFINYANYWSIQLRRWGGTPYQDQGTPQLSNTNTLTTDNIFTNCGTQYISKDY